MSTRLNLYWVTEFATCTNGHCGILSPAIQHKPDKLSFRPLSGRPLSALWRSWLSSPLVACIWNDPGSTGGSTSGSCSLAAVSFDCDHCSSFRFGPFCVVRGRSTVNTGLCCTGVSSTMSMSCTSQTGTTYPFAFLLHFFGDVAVQTPPFYETRTNMYCRGKQSQGV